MTVVEMRLNELVAKMGGHLLQGSPSLSFHEFNIDSRLTKPGELFFALVADRNGHDFIPQAAHNGAAGAVISQDISLPNEHFVLVRVEDTLQALQKLAKGVLSEHDVQIVGITGSIGKTTTKEFAAALLDPPYKVLKSEASYNNHIGLPLSILKLEKDHEIAVLEMGMNHAGEIKLLTEIAPPQVALITNIQPVHLEFFENIEDIAQAKKEILDGMDPDGTAVLKGDDEWVMSIAQDWKGEKILFGLSENCEVHAKHIQIEGFKGMSFELSYGRKRERTSLPFFYETTLHNYLAAVALGYAFAIPFEDILQKTQYLELYGMRGGIRHLGDGMTLIDDSYNSNPVALEYILKNVAELPSKRKVVVLGDMRELGKKSEAYHRQAGEQVVKYGYDILVTVGTLSRHMAEAALASGMPKERVHSFDTPDQAAENLRPLLEQGDLILIKGSRALKMEKIVSRLTEGGN
jgi:UDP-N-acetylmuramoyl-tripeptide--D-alanyl-D-alanine ligase